MTRPSSERASERTSELALGSAPPRTVELALAGTLALPCGGCGQEFLIGVLDGDGSGGATSASTGSSTLEGSATVGPDGTLSGSGSGTASGSATLGSSGSSDADTTAATDDVPPVTCEAPPGHTVCDTDGDPFHAIGLGCPGGAQDTQPIVDPQLASSDATAWRVLREYGNATWTASEGSNLLALTTGTLPTPDGSGYVSVPVGQTDAPGTNNGNPDGMALPAPVSPAPGSMGGAGGQPFMGCDGLGDCSDTLPEPWQAGGPARDLAWMSFDIDVPAGTFGYQVDLAWFSAEYPARAAMAGTDLVVWWQSSEAFTGNVATLDGTALSADGAAAWIDAHGLLGHDPALLGTGYEATTGAICAHPGGLYGDCPRGASTGWLTLTAPSEPGERMTIVVALFDLLDGERDTTVLLDDWHWYCPGCQPGVDCGLAP